MNKNFKHFTLSDRLLIKKRLDQNIPIKYISQELNVALSSIYNEIKRGTINNEYSPEYSQTQYEFKLKNKGKDSKLDMDSEISKYIAKYILIDKIFIKEIANILKREFNYPISKNTIYSAIDKGLIPNVTRDSLLSNTVKVFSNGLIQIPKHVQKKLNINDGDIISLEITSNTIILKK